jgi:Transposase DDE domain group 1
MRHSTGLYPSLRVEGSAQRVVSSGGSVLLVKTATAVRLDRSLSTVLTPWRSPLAVHDPGKVLLDLAFAVALGGDCLADIGQARSVPAVFGRVASDPTVSRLIDRLALDADQAVRAIDVARAQARAVAWRLAGVDAPDHEITPKNPLAIDTDATLLTAHSEKEFAAPTYKRGFGFHPLCVFVDHGSTGTGEPLTVLLRKGNAGANTAADHIAVVSDALRQLPPPTSGRFGQEILIRTDGAGGTHDFVRWLTNQGLSYSVGFGLCESTAAAIDALPEQAWTPAYDNDGRQRDGAWVAELTGVIDLDGWPTGMRVIVRAERPHPGAQLRFTDVDGNRLTAFATNTTGGQLANLELRHRRRARCEDRIRNAKDTGMRNLPLHDFNQNRVWLAVVQLAMELTAWLQLLALTGTDARRWEPKRLRLRLLWIAGKLARRSRRTWLLLSKDAPWITTFTNAINRLETHLAPL